MSEYMTPLSVATQENSKKLRSVADDIKQIGVELRLAYARISSLEEDVLAIMRYIGQPERPTIDFTEDHGEAKVG